MGLMCLFLRKVGGVGGRAPTRWLDRDADSPVGFDHGAQYFQATDPVFLQTVQQAYHAGAVAPWSGRVVDLGFGVEKLHETQTQRWVGTPGMASFGKYLAQGLKVHLQTHVNKVEKINGFYNLGVVNADKSESIVSDFYAVVCAMPAEQVAVLFTGVDKVLADLASTVKSNVTWSVMVSSESPLQTSFDGAFVVDSPLGWVCRDSSKPERAAGERWLLQATADWSAAHQDDTADAVSSTLLNVFAHILGNTFSAQTVTAHRWLYSLPANPLGQVYYANADLSLSACGDWLNGAQIENAFSSGDCLGKKLVAALG